MENKQYLEAYKIMEQWLAHPEISPSNLSELSDLNARILGNEGNQEAREEIFDRFYKDLDFGTGGLRGYLGAGTNRMNVHTVKRVTQGFANYLIDKYSGEERELSVAIAYDSRINSTRFALETSGVLIANGIKVYLYEELMPTPALSYAVRHYGCCGGVMVTASHNPAIYNGYKVYNEEGCQVTLEAATAIQENIKEVDFFGGVKTSGADWELYLDQPQLMKDVHPLLSMIPSETVVSYIEAVKVQRVGISCDALEVVYTPLNGAGNKPVRRILQEIGVGKVHVVPEQELPDGNFPTCPSPNPEKKETLQKGLSLCQELKTPDLLLATDPDCDRLSVAVRQRNEKTEEVSFHLLSGNEVGILLLDFICANKILPEWPVAIKTIVSSKMGDAVAKQYGVQMINVLTGFKFIGEQIGILESKGEAHRYVFGFEESSGYLSGSYVRDKDAVNAAMLVCEAAAFYKTQGKTLVDRMEELYTQHGYYKNDLLEFSFEGATGMEKMSEFLELLRSNPPFGIAGEKIVEIADYMTSERRILGKSCAMSAGYRPIKLPKSDVLEFILADGSSMIIRPSGTEPKLKIYLSARGSSKYEAETVIEDIASTVRGWI